MTPEEIILRKNLVSSVRPDGQGISSADWEVMSAALKERAFFSSRVASANFLDVCQSKIAEILQHAKNSDGAIVSRAEAVSAIMQAARAEGISLGSERVSDPGSEARANVIIDTNAGLAAGYAQAEIANTYGARLAFPAQELVRIERRERPRNWLVRWVKNGGRVYHGRMIALKGDPIWLKLSRFGVPYPPFDFNSGMGVEDVSREEAISLGVIEDDYEPPKASPLKEFNDGLEASMRISRTDDSKLKSLQGIFGDQIKYNPTTMTIGWEGSIVRDTLNTYMKGELTGRKSPDLGCASKVFLNFTGFGKSPHLRTPGSVLKHIYDEHVLNETDKRSVALTERELGLIGFVWRSPERCEEGDDGAVVLVRKAADGNEYRLVVTPEKNGGVRLNTFYKKNTRSGAGPNSVK